MGYLKDFYQFNLTIRKRYWLRELLRPRSYMDVLRFRRQRANRGWASRDAWGGGEHIAQVAAGILYELGDEKNIVDWEAYFEMNAYETYGYKNLHEVADDLQLYVDWDIIQWDDQFDDIRSEDRWAMDYQVYQQAINAMHFVADNLGGLWW